jgi:hypothetical protein
MRLKRCLVWLCAVFAASAPCHAAPVWGLPQLMQDLAQVQSASANFTERKTLHMLNAPLLVSGTLTYVAPEYIRKVTLPPAPETFVLDHGQVMLSGGADNQIHSFAVADNPQIGGLVEGIRATLAGDLPTLERFYIVRLTGTAANWQLFLQPKDASLAHFVTWIIIQGSQNRIGAIDTANGNGDHSEMGIAETINDAK